MNQTLELAKIKQLSLAEIEKLPTEEKLEPLQQLKQEKEQELINLKEELANLQKLANPEQ